MNRPTLTASGRTVFSRRQWLVSGVIHSSRRRSRSALVGGAWGMSASCDEGGRCTGRRRCSARGAVLFIFGLAVGIPSSRKLFVLSELDVS